MKPWLDDGDLRLYHGEALQVLQALPAGIVQTVVTSPPYWGLRDYGTGTWTGGDTTCDHTPPKREHGVYTNGQGQAYKSSNTNWDAPHKAYGDTCGKCGAQRVDDQLGLEATPELFVERLVQIFREVRRVLRPDGTCWINLGDSYCSTAPGTSDKAQAMNGMVDDWRGTERSRPATPPGLKPKDLVGIPWRVAFALQEDGWYLRSDIIWSKPNPMPESVTDRPTKSHEYLFLLTKSPRYYYDADAIREPQTAATLARYEYGFNKVGKGIQANGASHTKGQGPDAGMIDTNPAGRNRRSVWTIPTQPFPLAHFATYPEALVAPCILAGTSEKGGCAECGAPWRRVVERTRMDFAPDGRSIRGDGTDDPLAAGGGGKRAISHVSGQEWSRFKADNPNRHSWEPSCACFSDAQSSEEVGTGATLRDGTPSLGAAAPTSDPGHRRPQIVLDPFAGSGTTLLVARKHGRHSIGIDLSTEYLTIAANRTRQLSLLGGPA